jgi:hypothetical protein
MGKISRKRKIKKATQSQIIQTKEMKKYFTLVFSVLLSLSVIAQNSDPYKIFGHTSKVKYQSRYTDLLMAKNSDTLSPVKYLAFDMEKSTVYLLATKDSVIGKATFERESILRWLSVDPMAKERSWLTPYNFVQNNPLSRVDPTGALDDWVQDAEGNIKWDNNANSQATTKAGETYLGKTLTFSFNSYIDKKLWDGPLGSFPAGNKLTTTLTLTATENEKGEFTGASASMSSPVVGSTPLPPGSTGRDYYPGLGADQNKFIVCCSPNGSLSVTMEQHASVNKFEEFGMKQLGYNIVNVAQKLDINVASTGAVKVAAYTDVFPSATLSMNGTSIMQYNQPSFKATHSMPVLGHYSVPINGGVGVTVYDESYKPANWFRRF